MRRGRRSWPIIVGGSHRSGTTLVRRLLNGHPHIFCPPEIKFHKDLLGQFPNDPLAHGRLGRSIAALALPAETWLDEFGRAFCRCYDLATARAGKQRWADKNPENALNAGHWHRLLKGRMFFIMVVRHPLDVISSMAEVKMDKVIPSTVEGRAAHVRDYVAAGLTFAAQHNRISAVLRYEDVVSDPERAFRPVLDMSGERFADTMLRDLGSDAYGQGLEDPKARGRAELSGESVGRWRFDLTGPEVATAKAVVEPMALALGYNLAASA